MSFVELFPTLAITFSISNDLFHKEHNLKRFKFHFLDRKKNQQKNTRKLKALSRNVLLDLAYFMVIFICGHFNLSSKNRHMCLKLLLQINVNSASRTFLLKLTIFHQIPCTTSLFFDLCSYENWIRNKQKNEIEKIYFCRQGYFLLLFFFIAELVLFSKNIYFVRWSSIIEKCCACRYNSMVLIRFVQTSFILL